MKIALFLILIFSCAQQCGASVREESYSDCLGGRKGNCSLVISGKIEPSDTVEAGRLLSLYKTKSSISVRVNSIGGDVYAAMAIGRLLRRSQASIWIPYNEECASACVLLLAGAVVRSIDGPVEIHRLYTSSTNADDYDSLQSIYRKMEMDVKAYLHEMNVPGVLYDAMMQVPSQSVHALNSRELADYGFSEPDPVWADLYNSRRARELGISKAEILHRRAMADTMCGKKDLSPRYLICYNDFIEGRHK